MRAERIRFASDGTECAATVYRPDRPGPYPCVVLATGFGGTQDTPSIVAAAGAFARAGYAALTFDFRSFGSSGGTPRQIPSIPGQLDDLHAAIRTARGLPGVDPDRIALWGTSLGGGHVITVAAGDPRIAAVIAQVPFNGFPKHVDGRSKRAVRRVLRAMIADRLRGLLGLAPHYIPTVGDAGELAVMATAEAAQAVAALDSATWENRVAPRALFEMMRYKPGERAHLLRMPLLVCIGEQDRETVGEHTRELADRAEFGRLKAYPFAHFDIYRPEIRGRVLADQIDFLKEAIGAPGSAA
jgi:alpha-beta hydrolase superfamily lysophospholipase